MIFAQMTEVVNSKKRFLIPDMACEYDPDETKRSWEELSEEKRDILEKENDPRHDWPELFPEFAPVSSLAKIAPAEAIDLVLENQACEEEHPAEQLEAASDPVIQATEARVAEDPPAGRPEARGLDQESQPPPDPGQPLPKAYPAQDPAPAPASAHPSSIRASVRSTCLKMGVAP